MILSVMKIGHLCNSKTLDYWAADSFAYSKGLSTSVYGSAGIDVVDPAWSCTGPTEEDGIGSKRIDGWPANRVLQITSGAL